MLSIFPKIRVAPAGLFGMKRCIQEISNSCTRNVLDYPYFPPNYDVLTSTGTRVARVGCHIELKAARNARLKYTELWLKGGRSVVGSNVRDR